MSAVEPIFQCVPPPPAPAVEPTQIVETVGVEVVEDSSGTDVEDSFGTDIENPKVPANSNDVIPFASTLRRVG